jgi:hypothetical protein
MESFGEGKVMDGTQVATSRAGSGPEHSLENALKSFRVFYLNSFFLAVHVEISSEEDLLENFLNSKFFKASI